MFHLLKIRVRIDIFKLERGKVTFGLKYIILTFLPYRSQVDPGLLKRGFKFTKGVRC